MMTQGIAATLIIVGLILSVIIIALTESAVGFFIFFLFVCAGLAFVVFTDGTPEASETEKVFGGQY